MKRKATYMIIIFLLVFLFTYTGTSKLVEGHRFKAVLDGAPLIGMGAGVIAILLPLAELLTALLLLFSRTRLMGLYASLVILSVFTVYLVYMVLFVPHLPCSCGGVINMMGWREHIIFNVVLTGLTAVDMRIQKRWPPSRPCPQRGKATLTQP